ncbi:hypothetical protein GIB67_030999 [Kingdonia uniflora]|uniref:Senescence regulator n=1 Tax=Kingdonia uniflora TaxID=39325 RepID=A0A7J7NGA5_9MAGN|nr:hypothetical protein GIB67_030999 [Kingdonia uniflora]
MMFEFDEPDLYNTTTTTQVSSPEIKRATRVSSFKLKPTTKRVVFGPERTGSLPMNVPDWSKILREDYRNTQSRRDFEEEENDDDVDDDDMRIPPHEYLARQFARTRIASFSVHEGIGRTLKGRDLSRVRDAIWKKTGFVD